MTRPRSGVFTSTVASPSAASGSVASFLQSGGGDFLHQRILNLHEFAAFRIQISGDLQLEHVHIIPGGCVRVVV